MKIGNQFYLGMQVQDATGTLLDIRGVDIVRFTIGNLVKFYDGSNKEVSYDDEMECFKIWLTEKETLKFEQYVQIEIKVIHKPDTNGKRVIEGSVIYNCYWYECLNKVELDNNLPEPIVKVIVKNGTYSAVDDNVGYYDKVVVDVPEKKLGIKNIFQSGVKTVKYSANDDNLDGYSEVNVSTSGVDIDEYINSTIVYGQTRWYEMVKKLPTISCSSNVINLYQFFYYSKFEELQFSNFNTQNVVNMDSMFNGCNKLKTLDLSSFGTSKVTNMESMFSSCSSLTSLNLSSFNTLNVTKMSRMFSGCSSLISLDLSSFNPSNANSMISMFENCQKLADLDLSNFNTSKVTELTQMFYSCFELININGCLQNLGQAYETTRAANYGKYSLGLYASTKLTHDSLINIINGLYDIATKGCNTQSLNIGSTNVAKLTAEEIAIATNKGWTVS